MGGAVAAMGLFLVCQKRRGPVVAMDWFWVRGGGGRRGKEGGGENRLAMVVGCFPAVVGGFGKSLLVESAAVPSAE